jgi:NADH-quinone oxidoreductase subunit L
MLNLATETLICVLSPALFAVFAALNGKRLGNILMARLTICGISIALAMALHIAWIFFGQAHDSIHISLYTWAAFDLIRFPLGMILDPLSVCMLLVVTSISWAVHVYSIAYMEGDAGFGRFFCYVSLFTFAMLALVTADNFLQLFFGWEGVGLVSYLLIGFWHHKPSAATGSLKAFLVNRVGDFGFLLGMALILSYAGSLEFAIVYKAAPMMSSIATQTWFSLNISEWAALLLFIGVMAKSAQLPLHVWLPESMEGPTPISALIHAATMVTAGIYLICRMSPLFESAPKIQALILIIGASGALFLGILGVVQTDIKRVIAYSTLAQLGYMTAATGASAYSAAMFHLVTHAYFKALLFLAAGSVIVGMHHEQDLFKMGGLRKKMPLTHACFLIGALSLSALPPLSGFYSKDAILASIAGLSSASATYASIALTLGAFVTPLYIFRAYFLAFTGKARHKGKVSESSLCITIPLILLSIPSLGIGAYLAPIMLAPGKHWFSSIQPQALQRLQEVSLEFQNHPHLWQSAITHVPFWMSLLGLFTAWYAYVYRPDLPQTLSKKCARLYHILKLHYGFDLFNETVLVPGTQFLAKVGYEIGDQKIIERGIVQTLVQGFQHSSQRLKRLQTGYLYHYNFMMLAGLLVFLLLPFFQYSPGILHKKASAQKHKTTRKPVKKHKKQVLKTKKSRANITLLPQQSNTR